MSVVEYLRTQNGAWVPVVQGTLLHSSVEPRREAEQFVDQEWSRVETVQSLLVFGLGGGFHLEEILRRKKFDIIVIEAERDLEQNLSERNPGLMSQLEVLSALSPDLVAQELNQRGFFAKSYALLKHPASYRLQSFYYGSILKNLNERTLNRLRELAQNHPRLSLFLESLDIYDQQIVTLPMVEEALSRRGMGLEKEGLIWMAMRELVV